MIPPSTILVAVDFSDGSKAALALAARLARQSHAELHILHVEDPLLAAAASERGILLSVETREELARLVEGLPEVKACTPQLYVVTGRPVEVILDIAFREGADLIVVASHGMSGVERAFFGSVTEGLLQRADRSLLVVPAEWRLAPEKQSATGLGPFVVGVDFSSSGTAAAGAACRLAELFASSVELVHVVRDLPVLERWRSHAEAATNERVDLARRELAQVAGSLPTQAPITSRVETGPIPERLSELAVPWGARQPMLVLGKRAADRGGAPGALAYRVLTISRAPVLMHVA